MRSGCLAASARHGDGDPDGGGGGGDAQAGGAERIEIALLAAEPDGRGGPRGRGGEREDDAAHQFDLHVALGVGAALLEHDPGDAGDDQRAADRQRPGDGLAEQQRRRGGT